MFELLRRPLSRLGYDHGVARDYWLGRRPMGRRKYRAATSRRIRSEQHDRPGATTAENGRYWDGAVEFVLQVQRGLAHDRQQAGVDSNNDDHGAAREGIKIVGSGGPQTR